MWGSYLRHHRQEASLEGDKLDPLPFHGRPGLHQHRTADPGHSVRGGSARTPPPPACAVSPGVATALVSFLCSRSLASFSSVFAFSLGWRIGGKSVWGLWLGPNGEPAFPV